jgi:cytidylate kinase
MEEVAAAHIDLRPPTESESDGRLSTVLVNGEDVSWNIRTTEVSAHSSKVAVHPRVRAHMVMLQQHLAEQQDVVMEGRDITYRVLPNAQIKIFLTASEEARAARRLQQYQAKGENMSLEQVIAELHERDERDYHRTTDPLPPLPNWTPSPKMKRLLFRTKIFFARSLLLVL